MRDKSVIDSIDYYKSPVFLYIYRGGGWTHYKQTPRANSENLANKHSKKLGTLIYSARADRPDPRRGPSALFLVPNSKKWKRLWDIRLHENGFKRTNMQRKWMLIGNFGWNMQYFIITQRLQY
jgi:hypothetical protein